MTLIQIVILAVIQGITEFLPISSSGHLALTPVLLGWQDQGLIIDVAVHVGTLGAVIIYLWRDVWAMFQGLIRLPTGRIDDGARLAGLILLASIPVIMAGFAVKLWFGDALRTPAVIGWSFIGFGLLLYGCDRLGLTILKIEHMKLGGALMIGLAQVLALIPGASRAGVTITMARMMGYERRDAARFSMLLSIPAITGAGALATLDLIESGDAALQTSALLGALLSLIAALIAIAAMMGWLRRASFTPFVYYRVVVGVLILWLAV
ncbi:MAG: undecaprenyl-diphosphate phosphatase [Alphaproteobacteria bacterium]